MAWDSTLATAEETKAFVGNSTLTDAVLESVANGADAEIIDYLGSPTPVVAPTDSASAVADKNRELARRALAFKTLVLEYNRFRESGNPTFRGERMSADDFAERRKAALNLAGARALWPSGS